MLEYRASVRTYSLRWPVRCVYVAGAGAGAEGAGTDGRGGTVRSAVKDEEPRVDATSEAMKSQSNLEKEQCWKTQFPSFKAYHKAIATKTDR